MADPQGLFKRELIAILTEHQIDPGFQDELQELAGGKTDELGLN
jgi:hypothetical protein